MSGWFTSSFVRSFANRVDGQGPGENIASASEDQVLGESGACRRRTSVFFHFKVRCFALRSIIVLKILIEYGCIAGRCF